MLNKKRTLRHLLLILCFVGILIITDNPWKAKKLETNIPLITPLWNWFQDSKIKYGLDLQGGTQLDYEIDLSDAKSRNQDDVKENDVNIPSLLDGVKDVIERRVNSLGVAEPSIYLSSAGNEEHIVVELPGVKDIQEAKDRVGKVVQLEFKTEKGAPSKEDEEAITKEVNTFIKKILSEKSISDLEDFIQDIQIPNRIQIKKQEKSYLDEFPIEFQKAIKDLPLNTFYPEPIRAKENDYIFNEGQMQQLDGYSILRIIEKNKELRKRPVNAEDFQKVVQSLKQEKSLAFFRQAEIEPKEFAKEVTTLENGEISGVIETPEGFFIAKMVNKIGADTNEKASPQIRTAHILLKTQDSEPLKEEKPLKDIPSKAADTMIKRITKENEEIKKENEKIQAENKKIQQRNKTIEAKNQQVKKRAEKVLHEVKNHPEQFEILARKYSEDSSKDQGGDLGYALPTVYVEPYREAALKLGKNEITQELVQSVFGYHIIKLLDTKKPEEELFQFASLRVSSEEPDAKKKADELLKLVREESMYTVERVWFNAVPDPWQKTELDSRYFKRADVAYDQLSFRPYVAVSFNDEGAKIFEKLTEENIKKRLGIFVGGEFISAPVVQEKIAGGNAQITLGETNPQIALKEANNLASSLNAGAIPAPLKKPNELNIGASLGSEAMQKSLTAGIIGLILVSLFMLLYYRFLGLLASFALIIYGLFLIFLIQSELNPALAVFISFILWGAFSLRLIQSNIDIFGKIIFLGLSILGALFIFYILITPIVLTLAGVAGLILSIGMAVDANILIFERMKEEFAQGKSFALTVRDGFDRAWSSILDSNVSSLITCAILYSFGTSIIRGFAMNLAAGIVVSMFTAITVSRTFILLFEGTRVEEWYWLWKRKKS